MIEAVPLPKWKSSVPVKEPMARLRATNGVGAGVAGALDGSADGLAADGARVGDGADVSSAATGSGSTSSVRIHSGEAV